MTVRIAKIAVGFVLAGALAFAPQVEAKSAKSAAAKSAKSTAHAADKSDSANMHNAAPPGAETGMAEPQRLAIQADLVWLYYFGEMGAEEINAHLVDQIKAFQRRNNGKDTGVLSDQDRAALADAVKAKKAAAGWRLIDDTATGARIGIPEKLVPKTSATRTGSHWASNGGQVVIETFRLREASLPALFDQDKRTAQREIGSSNLEPSSFVITGQQGLKKFVERAQSSGNEVRGVTMLYDQATEGTMAPVAIAVADTFEGFPDPDIVGSIGSRRGVEYSSTVVVSSSGELVSSAQATEDCRSITVPGYGHAVRVAADATNDLALLQIYGARGLVPIPFADEAVANGALTLLGVADPLGGGNGDQVMRATAQLGDQGLNPVPKLGFSGAAAIDAQGRFAGIVDMKAAVVAGGAAVPQAALVPAPALRAFLQAQGIAVATGRAATDQSVLRMICVRR
jgi:hypothetical protein